MAHDVPLGRAADSSGGAVSSVSRSSPLNRSRAPRRAVPTGAAGHRGAFERAAPWPAPQAIPSGLPPVPAFVGRLLPAALTPWVDDIAERAQCPPDFVAVGAVVAAAAMIGRRVAIRPKRADDW